MLRKCELCRARRDNGSFCATLSTAEVDLLCHRSPLLELEHKSVLRDEILDEWPIIAVIDGSIGLQQTLADGRRTVVAFYMSGDYIDLRRPLRQRQVSLRALTNARLCRLHPAIFDTVQESNNFARATVYDNLREQTHRAVDHSSDLGKKQAIEKVASFICECRNRYTHDAHNGIDITVPMQQTDLAEYLGLQPETVSRCLRQLDQAGIVDVLKPAQITVKNLPKLKRLANGARP